jgi:hypothetical protein
MVCGVVESVNVPEAQVADAVAPLPFVALLQVNLTALNETSGQLVKDAAAAFTPNVQVLMPPFIFQVMVAALFPFTGVVSGSGEVKVMVAGTTVTLPVTANANGLRKVWSNAAASMGRFHARSSPRHTAVEMRSTPIVSRSAMAAVRQARLPR